MIMSLGPMILEFCRWVAEDGGGDGGDDDDDDDCGGGGGCGGGGNGWLCLTLSRLCATGQKGKETKRNKT